MSVTLHEKKGQQIPRQSLYWAHFILGPYLDSTSFKSAAPFIRYAHEEKGGHELYMLHTWPIDGPTKKKKTAIRTQSLPGIHTTLRVLYSRNGGTFAGGESRLGLELLGISVVGVRGTAVLGPSPASRSAEATPASVVSRPSALPIRAPACGTWSIGAFFRFAYPDLTRLLETDSLRIVYPQTHGQ
jgi:hypothetical protein